MKHWLKEQELLRIYLNFRGPWNNSLAHGVRDPLKVENPL
jgi:hypothetical protein